MNTIEKIKKRLTDSQMKHIKTVKEGEGTLWVEFDFNGNDNKSFTYDFAKNYMRVIANEKETKAEILLYGYIGQDFWFDEKLDEESITDLAVVRTIRDLETKYNQIDIRINSPGGSVYHGDPIITAMRNSKAEIHTYIDGMAASMGFDIWIAGDVRHMSVNAKAMCHATSSIEIGTAQDMREAADRLDKFDDAAVMTFAQATELSEKEIRERFYDDYKDHWLTAEDIKELGLITEIDDYEVEEVEEKASKELIKEVTRIEVLKEKEELTSEEMVERLEAEFGGNIKIEFTDQEETEEAKETRMPQGKPIQALKNRISLL
jgi:ATP-dependent protease ClpP protease subunit